MRRTRLKVIKILVHIRIHRANTYFLAARASTERAQTAISDLEYGSLEN